MNGLTRHLGIGAVVIAATLVTLATATAKEPDLDAIANRLVNQCAAIGEGDLVLIDGRPEDLKLLENVAVHVRKCGAFPMLTIATEDLRRRMYDEVPAQYDAQTPQMLLKLAETIDAAIMVSAEGNPALLAHVPAERVAAQHRAQQSVYDTMLSRNVRMVGLGNGIYPTPATAKRLGMSLDDLTTVFWDAVDVDYLKLQTIADTVRARLAAGSEIRITDERGTDLKLRIENRPIHVNDGAISTDDVRAGGAACQAWLPAGEIFLAPVPDSPHGTIVVDRHHFQGQEIHDLRLTFEQGRLTSMTAKSGLEPLKKLYDASGEGKDRFAAIDIGVNPNVHAGARGPMVAWMAAGMVTCGVGQNTWAGGDNSTDFALFTHLRDATMTVDGKPLVQKGTLTP